MTSTVKLALHGGGSELDSVLLDRCFVAWIPPEGQVLYLPIALGWERSKYREAEVWFRSIYEPLGAKRIEMWTDLHEHRVEELKAYDAVYIGGGNTFRLLEELRSTGFAKSLSQFAKSGGPIYGGSAGAAVLGKSIATVRHLDKDEKGMTDLGGLDLLDGYSVWVHYKEIDTEMVRNFVSKTDGPLVVLSERAGVIMENGKLNSVGDDPAYVVDGNSWQIIEKR